MCLSVCLSATSRCPIERTKRNKLVSIWEAFFHCFSFCLTLLAVGSVRWIKLTHVGFRAHVKIASRIVSYRIVLVFPSSVLTSFCCCLIAANECRRRRLYVCAGTLSTTTTNATVTTTSQQTVVSSLASSEPPAKTDIVTGSICRQ